MWCCLPKISPSSGNQIECVVSQTDPSSVAKVKSDEVTKLESAPAHCDAFNSGRQNKYSLQSPPAKEYCAETETQSGLASHDTEEAFGAHEHLCQEIEVKRANSWLTDSSENNGCNPKHIPVGEDIVQVYQHDESYNKLQPNLDEGEEDDANDTIPVKRAHSWLFDATGTISCGQPDSSVMREQEDADDRSSVQGHCSDDEEDMCGGQVEAQLSLEEAEYHWGYPEDTAPIGSEEGIQGGGSNHLDYDNSEYPEYASSYHRSEDFDGPCNLDGGYDDELIVMETTEDLLKQQALVRPSHPPHHSPFSLTDDSFCDMNNTGANAEYEVSQSCVKGRGEMSLSDQSTKYLDPGVRNPHLNKSYGDLLHSTHSFKLVNSAEDSSGEEDEPYEISLPTGPTLPMRKTMSFTGWVG